MRIRRLFLLLGVLTATASILNAGSAPPQSPDYWDGANLYNLGKLNDAYHCFMRAIKKNQNANEARSYLIQIRSEIVNNARSRLHNSYREKSEPTLFEPLGRKNDYCLEKFPASNKKLAACYERKEKYPEAILALNDLYNARPSDTDILRRMIACHESLHAQRLREAENHQASNRSGNCSASPAKETSDYLPEDPPHHDLNWRALNIS